MFKVTCTSITSLLSLLLVLVNTFNPVSIVEAAIECQTDADCQKLVADDSICDIPSPPPPPAKTNGTKGTCTNPFVKGCLYNHFNKVNSSGNSSAWTGASTLFRTAGSSSLARIPRGMRVCNSEDPVEARGVMCREPDFDYLEIRAFAGNWDSRIMASYLVQIILSEVLGVPATIENGVDGSALNFYSPTNEFEYGTNDKFTAVKVAAELGDCRLRNDSQSCANFVAEDWPLWDWILEMVSNKVLEPPMALGVVGHQGWYVTKFTVEADPSFATYLGLRGESNRRKVAETFLRPASWHQYCSEVSATNCTVPNDVAQRPPASDEEMNRMFVDGLYTGHFRATEENDCDMNPSTCTGHIADYQCDWGSFVEKNAYWNDIPVRSSGPQPGSRGYSYSQQVEIWNAANATKSNAIMFWWTPEPLVQRFQRTDAEMHTIYLPPPSAKCSAASQEQTDFCSANETERIGTADAACEFPVNQLWKLISTTIQELDADTSIPDALRSPAYDMLMMFKSTVTQYGELFDYWRKEPSPRQAVCQWIVEHLDFIQANIPTTYPRVLQEQAAGALPIVTASLGAFTLMSTLLTAWCVYRKRQTRIIKNSQIEFLGLLLIGSMLISVGVILVGIHPSNASCTAIIWFVNIGYTLELVPLIVKVAAVHRLMVAARRFRKVIVPRRTLYGAVFLITFLMVIFNFLWSFLETPKGEKEYELTKSLTENGEIIVTSSEYCNIIAAPWQFIAVVWNFILLFCASVLAFQIRKLNKDYHEATILVFLIYSHFLFVCFRLILCFLMNNIRNTTLVQILGIIFSIDTLLTLLIYFAPKLLGKDEPPKKRGSSGNTMFFAPSNDTSGGTKMMVCPSCGQSELVPLKETVAAIPQRKNINQGGGGEEAKEEEKGGE